MSKGKNKHPYHGSRNQGSMMGRIERRRKLDYDAQLDIALQLCQDAAMLAAHEVLGMGPGRAERFRQAYVKAVNDITGLWNTDGKDDPDLEWSIARLDEALKRIVGPEHFLPWEVRYG